ncbi:predicted protein [Streptomyces iranensis]|uniref:Uncharacterized protein n=1 Tax=Streptomyces iranensis TaxID=576784 RepID=A0A060ZMN2_9ACTN|nr:predicted protein [Streptomyces iranensis]
MVGLAAVCAAVALRLVRSTTVGRGGGMWWAWLKRGQTTDGEGPAAGHCSRIMACASADCLRRRKYGSRAAMSFVSCWSSSISRTALSSRPVVACARAVGIAGQAGEPSMRRAP